MLTFILDQSLPQIKRAMLVVILQDRHVKYATDENSKIRERNITPIVVSIVGHIANLHFEDNIDGVVCKEEEFISCVNLDEPFSRFGMKIR